MKIPYTLLLALITINCWSQFSKTHYIPPLSNSDFQEPQGQYLYISCPSLKDVAFKLIEIGGKTITGTVSQNNPFRYDIGAGYNTQLLVDRNDVGTIKKNKGYIVEAENQVYVTVRLTSTPKNYQAGGLVSKGLAALGTEFRVGAFTNKDVADIDENHYTFASILATENNTHVQFKDIKNGVSLVNSPTFGNQIAPIILNRGESYVYAVEGINDANRDGLIGSGINSDKPIVVNCGSFAGTNGNLNNLDLGFDQIVSSERTGKKYIFIRGGGVNIIERPLLVANENNTQLFKNGETVPFATLNAGEYVALDGKEYSTNGNLYIEASKNIFAYQGIGGTLIQANQNMHFVPPLSCETPNIINNIPFINKVGDNPSFTGTVCVVTEKNADLVLMIDGKEFTLTTLPANITHSGPFDVIGNPEYVTYTFDGLTGNIAVKSTKSVYLSYYGSSGAATYGGFYSGFTFKPEVALEKLQLNANNCIPNTKLNVSEDLGFDTFQWFWNENPIQDATKNYFQPTKPGYYYVSTAISTCHTNYISDKIPVSNCPIDVDADAVADDMDLDLDNDGITNCDESLGNTAINLNSNSVENQTYTDFFTKEIFAFSETNQSLTPTFSAKNNGDFISEVPIGKNKSQILKLKFVNPISISMKYVSVANATDLLQSTSEFAVKSDEDKTITVLNPDNQLLIDTNFDGIYENNVTVFSSFEIRFRLNSASPLAAGTGTFSFQTYLSSSFTLAHFNLSDTQKSIVTFSIQASCVPKDDDADGIMNSLDVDSDNDGIPDLVESQLNSPTSVASTDANKDGLYDIFGTGTIPIDTDRDGVVDYLDLDSDNDGVFDMVESGTNATNQDFDSDGIKNFREIDSDNDGCKDVVEAGFSDANNDGILGNISPPTIDSKGVVLNVAGYTIPNINYSIAAPIIISKQPELDSVCEFSNAKIFIVDNGGNSYQWQISTDGLTWSNLTEGIVYQGVNTKELQIIPVKKQMDGFQYRVQLNKTGNSCGLVSDSVRLKVDELTVLNNTTEMIQCDDDFDGISRFNLTEKNNVISVNYKNEKFAYYLLQEDVITQNKLSMIPNPVDFESGSRKIWVSVENAKGCFSVAEMNLVVTSTQIPSQFFRKIEVCDDVVENSSTDTDGISSFDFSGITADVLAFLPEPKTNYVIKYYTNQTDAFSETNQINDITNYRNIGFPFEQAIWLRIESKLDNSCYGLGQHIRLVVNPKPNIDLNADGSDNQFVCSNLPLKFISLDAALNDGTAANNYTYIWTKDGTSIDTANEYTLKVNQAGLYSVKVTSKSGCYRTRTIKATDSNAATIDKVEIIDLVDNNSVTVFASGIGKYEYSLDLANGPLQLSNLFENVSSGIHDVYVTDLNGCGTTSKTIAIIGIPDYFTPNGDGFNDYWTIRGVNGNFNSKSMIYILDRYGKLIKQILPSSQGWDGTFNSLPLPADDYWFTLQLEDGRSIKGHFSLKR